MATVPPNWYPDPQDTAFLRYWNGTEWTDTRAPASAEATAEQPQPAVAQAGKVPLLGARAYAKRQSQVLAEALADNQRLRAQLDSTGGLEIIELQRLRNQLAAQITAEQAQLDDLRSQLIKTREEQVLQEVGIYEYRHPLSDAVGFRDALTHLQGEIKEMARRDGGAIQASTAWVVGDSASKGRKMIREYSTLMLRAYNAEADNLVRGLKPHKLPNAQQRLNKVAEILERLGETMQLQVAPKYHALRHQELELTADYLEILARQKDEEREQRDKLREENNVRRELAREREALERQQQHCVNDLTELEAAGNTDTARAGDLRAELEDLESRLTVVKTKEENIRAGCVYVISNIGAFGEGVIQIGVTRRHDPRDRIRELSSAAVPFKYDLHTMFFDYDAVGIEEEMHRLLADRRVNKVNKRREFFHTTPAEVRDHLQKLTGQLIVFNEIAEATEFRQSRAAERAADQE
ncbi:DUF4041 domain-containing protein [Nocardia sp. NPDC049707]|uniref:DUF4041 domain-containing protein n=1 Tax=Nocardia sp. NPDC049707 TaxID=3154735 RepID=UPI0034457E5A